MISALFIFVTSLFAQAMPQARYVDVATLVPGQMSISYKEVEDKLRKDGWSLRYADGQAWVDIDEAAPVLQLANGKFLMSDKHHHLMASLRAGATLYPISVVKDLSHLTLEEAYIWAQEHNMIYLEPEENLAQLKFMRMIMLKDNPWRWLVNQIRVKLKVKYQDGKLIEVEVKASPHDKILWRETPVWGKIIDEAAPFSELALATLTRLSGIPADADVSDKSVIENVRKAWAKAQKRHSPLIAGIPVITKKTPLEKINWKHAIQNATQCEKLINP